jgi:hypothetical protein
MENVAPGLYEHYKGGRYRVLFTGTHSETLEPMTVYMSMETGEVWVRPEAMWAEAIEWYDGIKRPRFIKVEEALVRHSISSNIAG